jgi:hypothetical protein
MHSWRPSAPAGGYNVNSYSYDDGTSENAVHVTNGAGGSTCWIHMFTAVGGSDTITTVSTAWGAPIAGMAGNPTNGTAANVCVWSDPNQDGNPIDAVLLTNVATTVSASGTDTIVPVAIPSTPVSGKFFVGAFITPHAQAIFPAPMDTGSASLGRAWVCGNGGTTIFDPTNLAAAGLPPIEMDAAGLPAVFLLRAEGSGSAPIVYCVAKVNSLGCTPTIGFSGAPVAANTSGFLVNGSNVRNNKSGILFYGANTGQASTPFTGGTLCVKTPIRRTQGLISGGNPAPANDCSGVYSIDMNAFAHQAGPPVPPAILLVPGTQMNVQFWGRDPGFPAPNNTTLTDALQYNIG